MNIVAPGTSAAAFNAVRRLLNEESGVLRSPAPVAAVLAAAGEGEGGATTATPAEALSGRVVAATVVSRLGAGGGIVDIAGERFAVRAHLPAEGEPVTLRFSAPQATAPAGAVAPSQAYTGLAAANAGASAVSLGPLAQTLAEVARTPVAPLDLGPIAAPPDEPRAFAQALAGQVRDSGAFYESHLERWSRGDYPLEALRREPQAGAIEARAPARLPAEPAAPASATAAAAQGIDSATQPIVREQLDLIENRCLSVTMQAWPGQRAELEIVDEREARDHRATPDGAWSTRLGLDLPHLGHFEARLALTGNRLHVAVRSADPDALEARGADLRAALKRAGLNLVSFRVDHDPDA